MQASPQRRAMGRKPLILVSLLLAAFVINVDTTIINVALPTLVREVHTSNSQLQWVVDAFNLVFAASVLAAGSLSDRFGRKGMLLAGLSVFGMASIAGGLTGSPGQLIGARAVMGVGAAMVFPSTLSLITNVFIERRERALAIGLWGAITGVAIALGPIVGGWLLELFGWRSIFFAMAPVAAIAGILVAGYVPASRDPHAPRTDRAGFALSTAVLGLLVYTIIEAPTYGWGSARTLGSFAVTALLAGAFVTHERRTAHPMLDVSLFRNPRFTAASASLAMTAFYLWVATSSVTTSYGTIAAQMVVLGTGMGLTSAPATEAIMGVVPKAKAGVGSAVNDATRLLGGTLGVAVIGSVYASLYAGRLTSALPPGLPARLGQTAHASVGAALTAAGKLSHAGHPALAMALHDAASSAFFNGFHAANFVSAAVAAAGALMALVLLPAHPRAGEDDTPEM